MKKLLLIGTALLIAFALWWRATDQTADVAETEIQAPATSAAPKLERSTGTPAAGPRASPEEITEQSTSALAQARQAKAAAEAELAHLDEQLAEVETYIEDLEAQGLNPVEYSEEGMKKMQPILAAYLDVEVRLAAAEAALEQALQEAEAETETN